MEDNFKFKKQRRSKSHNRLNFFTKWLQSPKYNTFIENVNILPFKCPLTSEFNSKLDKRERFFWKDIYEFSVEMNKPITDVIDLTDIDKYYSAEQLDPYDINHHKFLLDRRNIPDDKTVNQIIDKMDEILKNGGIVGIHCLHGRNRTGYIVCSYLIKKLGWKPLVALEAFGKARGEKISKKQYIRTILELEKKS